ncbi:hypothetical protein PGB90_007364 [Kerria lacca]
MVYIASDGTIKNGPRPWGMKRISDTFWSFIDAVGLFIETLLPFPVTLSNRSIRSSGSGSSFQPSSGRRSGPSNRPTGGFRTISDIAPPPMCSGGGCSGGGCGM